jgi:hypothetical protein
VSEDASLPASTHDHLIVFSLSSDEQFINCWDVRSRNDKALGPSKSNNVGIDGEPHNALRPAFATVAANGRDQITERQCLLLVVGFHGINIRWATRRALWGVHPTGDFVELAAAFAWQHWHHRSNHRLCISSKSLRVNPGRLASPITASVSQRRQRAVVPC